jgi:hypothetical protein
MVAVMTTHLNTRDAAHLDPPTAGATSRPTNRRAIRTTLIVAGAVGLAVAVGSWLTVPDDEATPGAAPMPASAPTVDTPLTRTELVPRLVPGRPDGTWTRSSTPIAELCVTHGYC